MFLFYYVSILFSILENILGHWLCMISTSSCRPGLCKYFILLLLLFRTLALPNLYQLVSPWSLQSFFFFRTLPLQHCYQWVSPGSLQIFHFYSYFILFRTLTFQNFYKWPGGHARLRKNKKKWARARTKKDPQGCGLFFLFRTPRGDFFYFFAHSRPARARGNTHTHTLSHPKPNPKP